MDTTQQPIEPLDLDEKELHEGIEEMDAQEDETMTKIPKYIVS